MNEKPHNSRIIYFSTNVVEVEWFGRNLNNYNNPPCLKDFSFISHIDLESLLYSKNCPGNGTIIGEREKVIHEYLANLSRSIGFAEEELVSLYDLPGILSFPKGIAWVDNRWEYLPQSFVFTRYSKNGQMKDIEFVWCLRGWESAVNHEVNGTKIEAESTYI